MTLNGAIMQLVEMRENSMMPDLFKPYFDKVIETISECVEPSELPHWIPCSERLPEEGEAVLTQAKFKDDVKMAVSSRIDYNYWTTWGTRDINIIAWMPLPELYKGEQK